MYRDDPYCAENVPSLVLWYIPNARSSTGLSKTEREGISLLSALSYNENAKEEGRLQINLHGQHQ